MLNESAFFLWSGVGLGALFLFLSTRRRGFLLLLSGVAGCLFLERRGLGTGDQLRVMLLYLGAVLPLNVLWERKKRKRKNKFTK